MTVCLGIRISFPGIGGMVGIMGTGFGIYTGGDEGLSWVTWNWKIKGINRCINRCMYNATPHDEVNKQPVGVLLG